MACTQVQFEEVFGEPGGIRSVNGVWKTSFICYNGTLNCCYKLLSIFCAVPLACCWGFGFACIACMDIWCYAPYIRALTIRLSNMRRIITLCLDTWVGPFCAICSHCLPKMAVKSTN